MLINKETLDRVCKQEVDNLIHTAFIDLIRNKEVPNANIESDNGIVLKLKSRLDGLDLLRSLIEAEFGLAKKG